MNVPEGPRVLTCDIETAPAVVETWGLHNVFISIDQIREPGTILGFGYKWHGERAVRWTTDVAAEAARLLDEADLVVTYNGNSFDLKHLRREILLAGLTPPSPFKSIDLYGVVRRQFKFQSNKLGFVAEQLGVGAKASTGGYSLWKGCMSGDVKSWRKMASYCKQDVRVTEALYDRLLPWISGHPNVNLWRDSDQPACPRCASSDLERRGFHHAVAQSYQQYRCRACGAWSRGLAIEKRAGETRAV